MPRRSAAAAFSEYRRVLQSTIGCVTETRFRPAPDETGEGKQFILSLNAGLPAVLQGLSRLQVFVGQGCRIEDDPALPRSSRVQMTSYFYQVLDTNGSELLAYHWHPNARGGVTHPHLHVRWDTQIAHRSFHRLHLPTGRVALEDIIHLLISELDAKPLVRNWEARLRRNRERLDEVEE